MTSAIERARVAVSDGQQELALGMRVRELYSDFFLWNDRQPGESLIEVVIPEFSEKPRSCQTRFHTPIEPNEQGERSRWVFSITGNTFNERVILAHYQYWGSGISENQRPSYTETYWFTNGAVSPLHATGYANRDKATEICGEIALLIGSNRSTETAFAPRQPRGRKR